MALYHQFSSFFHIVSLSRLCLTQQPGIEEYECFVDIKFINCSGRSFTTLVDYLPYDAEHLDLSNNSLTVIYESFISLRHLRVLLINDNNVSTLADGAFSLLESLQKLDLSRNRISHLSEGFSLGLGVLRELLLVDNQLTSLYSGSFMHLDSLQKLNLKGNAIRSIQVRAFDCMTALRQLNLEDNQLSSLSNGIFSMLRSLEVLELQGNHIGSMEVGVFLSLSSLTVLNLAHNQLTTICFKTFLSIQSYSTHILVKDNPWHCTCELQRVFRKLRSVQRLFLDDYYNLSCQEPLELQGFKWVEMEAELCIAETFTVLIITITVVITVVAAIIMAEKNKRRHRGQVWSRLEGYALE